MKIILAFFLFLYSSLARAENPPSASTKTLYEFSQQSITGESIPLSRFKGKVLLIVNTASKCGFTPQYHDLEELYKEYQNRGFEVLGFPSNDFAGQEPLSNSEIKKFCALKFGVTFPLFARGVVSGPDKQPLFKFLTEESAAEDIRGEIAWNFEKFIVGRDGRLKARFGSFINPESQRVKTVLERLLAEGAA